MSGINEKMDSVKSGATSFYENFKRTDHWMTDLRQLAKGWRKVSHKDISLEEAVDELNTLDVSTTINVYVGRWREKSLKLRLPGEVVDHIENKLMPRVENKDIYIDACLRSYAKGSDVKTTILLVGGDCLANIGDQYIRGGIDFIEKYEYLPAVRELSNM